MGVFCGFLRVGLRALRSVCSFAAQRLQFCCAANSRALRSGILKAQGQGEQYARKTLKARISRTLGLAGKSPGLFAAALKMFFALCFQGFAKNRDKLSRKKRDKGCNEIFMQRQ